MYSSNRELYHHGIKFMKWGIRRFQNEDGTLTEAGRLRYNAEAKEATRKATLNNLNAKAKNERKLVKAEARADRAVIKTQMKADKKIAKINNKAAVMQSKNDKNLIKSNSRNSTLKFASRVAITALGISAISKALAKGSSSAAEVVKNNAEIRLKDIPSTVIDADFKVLN